MTVLVHAGVSVGMLSVLVLTGWLTDQLLRPFAEQFCWHARRR